MHIYNVSFCGAKSHFKMKCSIRRGLNDLICNDISINIPKNHPASPGFASARAPLFRAGLYAHTHSLRGRTAHPTGGRIILFWFAPRCRAEIKSICQKVAEMYKFSLRWVFLSASAAIITLVYISMKFPVITVSLRHLHSVYRRINHFKFIFFQVKCLMLKVLQRLGS